MLFTACRPYCYSFSSFNYISFFGFGNNQCKDLNYELILLLGNAIKD